MKKAKLILLENPIIVTDNPDEKKIGDYTIGTGIIISTNKQIDYNNIDFGVVDECELGMQHAKKVWGVYVDNKASCDSDLSLGECATNDFIEGFKASQKLNEKKFSLEEIEKAIEMARKGRIHQVNDKDVEIDGIYTCKEIIATLPLPKTFEVEIEETSTHIKILRKL